MAPGTIVNVDSSIERKPAEFHDLIPEDIFEAALVASEHDSDGEDPFGPQPKLFMQTEHQKKQQKRDLEIRKVAWTLRKMRKEHITKQQRLKKRKHRASPFEKLPSDLILKLMQHTYLHDLLGLANSSVINRSIFRANETAIYRGIEIEQFSDWTWFFGNTVHRTSAQLQHLKDAISVEYRFGASHLAYKEKFVELLRMIDNKKFTGMQNLMFLQDMQSHVSMDIEAIESYTTKKIARRTAICLRSLGFQRVEVVEEDDRVENGTLVQCVTLPWEARSELILEQPARIQAEIRSVLMSVVGVYYTSLEMNLIPWIWTHYDSPGHHQKPQEIKKWMSKLVTGLILEEVIPQWNSDTEESRTVLSFDRQSSIDDVAHRLTQSLVGYGAGTLDPFWEIKDVVEFGRSIGLDLEGQVEGTSAASWIDFFCPSDDTEA